MNRWVEITFDCLPLRSVVRLDVPLDASPKFQAFCDRVKAAIDKHGKFNSFYLYNGRCTYHLTNRDDLGMIQFRFEGTVLTDEADLHTVRCDLDVSLLRETCSWLSEPIVEWLRETVLHSVGAEFDRYIEAGDLEQTRRRIEQLQAAADQTGGFIGMYL
jgi:hypothetical protein